MYSYCFRAVKNYKEAFQFIHTTKMEHFNSRSYFYCINNRINPLTIAVDLSRVPPVVVKGQNYTELLKELWDRTKQIKGYKKTMSLESCQPNAFYTA